MSYDVGGGDSELIGLFGVAGCGQGGARGSGLLG